MSALLIFLAGVYCGGAFVTFVMVKGGRRNRTVSALFWPTFPLWPL